MPQILYGPYPMTIAQMSEWSEQVSRFNVAECAKALHHLDTQRIADKQAD